MSKIEECYNEKGDAKHYETGRLNAIHKYERIYGTLAVMVFCEINAEKYRERLGKKSGQSIEQELLKIKWYEMASSYYFDKLYTHEEIVVDNTKRHDLPWK